ncbi:hypothetical protein EVAR_71594_1 [Eumeta japonica]|uniref:Uncharacterized protein n=1 Tax=Eumeta variegata TaxID=151549 RepID=A0A4C1SSU3_EUMVA|nr:hypothetical protein EVAR_71594_1 [Eumeta japonica]
MLEAGPLLMTSHATKFTIIDILRTVDYFMRDLYFILIRRYMSRRVSHILERHTTLSPHGRRARDLRETMGSSGDGKRRDADLTHDLLRRAAQNGNPRAV